VRANIAIYSNSELGYSGTGQTSSTWKMAVKTECVCVGADMCVWSVGTEDAATDQHGAVGQAAVVLFVLYHRNHHVSRLGPGSAST